MYVFQISCIVLVLFLSVLYASERKNGRETQKLFSVMLAVSVLLSVMEIFLIYTVQNIETVSSLLFKSVHRTYLTLVLSYFYLNFRYMSSFIKEEVGEPAKSLGFIHGAQFILYAGIFLLPLGYEKTEHSVDFSYGPGVWVVYVGAAFYLFVIFSNYCGQMRRIAREKILPLVWGVGFGMCICFYYMCVPSSYITGLAVVIMDVAFYLSLRGGMTREPEKEELFEVTLSSQAVPTEMSAAYKVKFEASGARVLVVDDSEMNRKVLKNLLKRTKIQVEEASGGKECLELVKHNSYHIIFMDHLMPEMDGLETFETIRNEHLCDETAVIAMTANTVSMTEQDYLSMGFAAYIGKPINPDKLEVTVFELLEESLIDVCEKTSIGESVADKEKEATVSEPEEEKSETESWDDCPAVDGLDYGYAALHFADPKEHREMIQFLLGVMKPDANEIEGYYANLSEGNNLKNFQTKVHSMKNSVMTVGIVPLAGLAKTLEDAAREENRGQIEALMPVFVEKWEYYRLLLAEKFATDCGERIMADVKSEEICDLFKRLRDAAAEMDIDGLDCVMEEINGYAFAPEYEEKLQKIRLAVMNFEVEYLQKEGWL